MRIHCLICSAYSFVPRLKYVHIVVGKNTELLISTPKFSVLLISSTKNKILLGETRVRTFASFLNFKNLL